jgi:hypothetical protein
MTDAVAVHVTSAAILKMCAFSGRSATEECATADEPARVKKLLEFNGLTSREVSHGFR